jgi:hypothetical protein
MASAISGAACGSAGSPMTAASGATAGEPGGGSRPGAYPPMAAIWVAADLEAKLENAAGALAGSSTADRLPSAPAPQPAANSRRRTTFPAAGDRIKTAKPCNPSCGPSRLFCQGAGQCVPRLPWPKRSQPSRPRKNASRRSLVEAAPRLDKLARPAALPDFIPAYRRLPKSRGHSRASPGQRGRL